MKGLAYGAKDTGMIRESNEDSYILLPEKDIYIVADGMGGHNAGEVASQNAVKIVGEYFTPAIISEMKEEWSHIKKEIVNAIEKAHGEILKMSHLKSEYAGMGCTIVFSFIHNNILHACHVGDSRIYVINQSEIKQVTEDHSTVTELVRMGKMTREEARLSPLKNQITQALGSSFPIDPEYNEYPLNKGDIVLMCSDGLWDMLSDEEIHNIVMEGSTLEKTCKKLIEKANESGGYDNITVVLVKNTNGF